MAANVVAQDLSFNTAMSSGRMMMHSSTLIQMKEYRRSLSTRSCQAEKDCIELPHPL